MSEPLIVQGVSIPFSRAAEGCEAFITPDWTSVFDFYPEWRKLVKAAGGDPWPIQPYVLEVCKVLGKHARPGERTSDEWFNRIFEHFGVGWFEKKINEARSHYIDG